MPDRRAGVGRLFLWGRISVLRPQVYCHQIQRRSFHLDFILANENVVLVDRLKVVNFMTVALLINNYEDRVFSRELSI